MTKRLNLSQLILAGLILFPLGYVIGKSASSTRAEDSTVHSADSHDGDSHAVHTLYEVPDATTAPQIVSFEATPDTKAGWNITLATENFTITPQNAGDEHVDNEGHVHLYIDGAKVARLYSNSYHLEHVEEGMRELTITLNTNDHQEYAIDGSRIEATTFITDTHHTDQ